MIPAKAVCFDTHIFVSVAGQFDYRHIAAYASVICRAKGGGQTGQKIFVIINGEKIMVVRVKTGQFPEGRVSELLVLISYQYGIFVKN